MEQYQKYTESTTYGELESVTIYYFYLKSDDVKWDYAKRNGKLELTHHHSERPEGSEKREYPFYKVDLYYVNNKDKNNWGSVKIRLWLSPSGRIINVYTFDCRGKQGEFTPGKSIGDDWFNFNVAY